MLVDSNIIIYAAKPEHEDLRRLIAEEAPAVSAVSYVEVLGYQRLEEHEKRHFEAFFGSARILPLSQPVLDEAVRLESFRKELARAGRLTVRSGQPSLRKRVSSSRRS